MRFLLGSSGVFALAMVALVAVNGCRRDRFADGIGRPDQQPIDSPVLSGLLIVEVKPADVDAFVELSNPTAAAVDLTGYVLRSAAGDVTLSGSLGPGERLSVPATALFPAASSTQSGEVALVDGSGTVQSYLAWGSDPSAAGSTLFVSALQSGAGSTGSVVAVPYPRPLDSSIVREGGFVGCFTPSPGAVPAGAACAVPAATLALREVAPGNGSTVPAFVEIENVGAEPIDLTGVRVCHDGECAPIPAIADTTVALAPATPLVLCLGPVTAASPCPAAGVALEGSTPISGDTETFIAAPGTTFDATAIVDYMRTFGGRTTYEQTAIDDGLWTAAAAPLGTYVRGESLSRDPGALTPSVWNPARATPGTANPVIDRATNWETCTEPAAPATVPVTPVGAANLFITIVSRIDGTITLTNIGPANPNDAAVNIDLRQFLVTIDDIEVQEGGLALAGFLEPNRSRTIPAAINDSGKLEVRARDPNSLLQFAQWGNPGPGVTAAVAANRWPREDCILPRLAVGESLVARLPVIADVRDRSLLRGSSAFSVE